MMALCNDIFNLWLQAINTTRSVKVLERQLLSSVHDYEAIRAC